MTHIVIQASNAKRSGFCEAPDSAQNSRHAIYRQWARARDIRCYSSHRTTGPAMACAKRAAKAWGEGEVRVISSRTAARGVHTFAYFIRLAERVSQELRRMESWGEGPIPLPGWVAEVSPNVKQISLAKCATTGRPSREHTSAHAHVLSGLLCIFREDRWNPDFPTSTFLHETAHIDTPNDNGHGREWRERYATLRRQWLNDHTSANRLRMHN